MHQMCRRLIHDCSPIQQHRHSHGLHRYRMVQIVHLVHCHACEMFSETFHSVKTPGHDVMVCNIHVTSRVKGEIIGTVELTLTTLASCFAKTTDEIQISVKLLAMPQGYSNCLVLQPSPPTVFTSFPSELNLDNLYDSTL